MTTIAGGLYQTGHADGTGAAATFNQPLGVAMNSAASFALIVRARFLSRSGCFEFTRLASFSSVQVDTYNSLIRSLIVSTGLVTTIAGAIYQNGHADGSGSAATFNTPFGIAMDAAGALALVVSRGQGRQVKRLSLVWLFMASRAIVSLMFFAG